MADAARPVRLACGRPACVHQGGSRPTIPTIMVNKAGTHQVCVGCDWKRKLKKWERAFRRWALRRSTVLLGDPTARSAFKAGWDRNS